jgi:hypothetical protein
MSTRWHQAVAADWMAVCCEQPVPSHPKDALLGYGLGTVQATQELSVMFQAMFFHSSIVQC